MYSKLMYGVLFSLASLATGVVQATETENIPDPVAMAEADCSENGQGPAVRVRVSNIRDNEGNLRAQVYGANPDEFLEKGKKLIRVDVPVQDSDEQDICVPFPVPGRYGLVVMHDRNANGKADFFSEGFGFSNNPKLRLAAPDGEDVLFDVPDGISETEIELKYIFGADEQQDKRRKLKRR